jgi:hypothetical protein
MLQQFHVDKSVNVIIEALAEQVIQDFWARQGKRVQVYENRAKSLDDQRQYDRRDSLGNLWEIKSDRSEANYYLIFAQGQAYIIERYVLCALVAEHNSTIRGGDALSAVGTLIPLDTLKLLALNV